MLGSRSGLHGEERRGPFPFHKAQALGFGGLRLAGFGRSLVAHLRSLSDAEFGFCRAQAAKGFPVQGAG